MTFTLNQIYTVKINSGEELIAKVLEVEGNFITISDPVSIAPGPKGMGLVPSMFTADPGSEVRLNINSISLYGLTEDNVKMKYIEAVTGISLPGKKNIILG